MIDDNTKFFINPISRFVIGGPPRNSGLTGRKIIVDTYGGYASRRRVLRKRLYKVNRSAAYAARYVARTSWQQDLQTSAKSSCPTQSALHIRLP